MNIEVKRKLMIPMDVKALYPHEEKYAKIKASNHEVLKNIFTGTDDRLLLPFA